jgi:hypothetical protein
VSLRAAVAAAALLSLAAAPRTWRHPDGKAADGVAEDVSVSDSGRILLAPASEEILPGREKVPAPPLLWSAALDLKGTVYVGGGASAKVLRVDRKGKAETVFEAKALGVRALAADLADGLFVATFPGGRVYRVGAEGKTEVYFEPEERYLWAMAADAFDRLYVASGERGVVYVITGRGEGRPFFDSDEPHITALAADPTGRLLAGSAGRGLLYRLDAEGRPEVILDSRLDEVSAVVAASDGTVYAAAQSEPGPARPRRPGDKGDEMTIEVTPAEGDSLLEEAASQRRKLVIDLADLIPAPAEGKARPASQVFRALPGRTPLSVWSSSSERAYALALDARGHLLFGTGPSGNLYRLEPDGSTTLLKRFPAAQVTAITTGADGRTYVLTSNPGRAHVLEPHPASSGRYLSPVHDAGSVAAWGSVRFEADTPPGTRVEVALRSGNSPAPDETWSGWSSAHASADPGPAKAPPARYVQWRADLSRLKTETTPVLRNVVLTYLPENLPPAVKGVTVGEPGAPRPAPPSPSKPEGSRDRPKDGDEPQGAGSGAPAEGAAPGRLWLSWTSSDPDGDALAHVVSVKRAEDAGWTVLARGWKEPPFAIDPASLTEGRYTARVEVSDAEANGPDRALSAEARSDPFQVDRTPPVVEPGDPAESDGLLVIPLVVRDATSLVARAEWAPAEGGPWTALAPLDGIADTPRESFSLKMRIEEAPRRIFVRAADAAANSVTVEVPLSRPR